MNIKRFNCNIPGCKKTFRSEENLMSHLLSHKDQQEAEQQTFSFECDICSKKFPTKRSVSAHKRVHKSDKEFHISCNLAKVLGLQLSACLQNDYSQEDRIFLDEQELKLPEISCPHSAVLPRFESVLKQADKRSFEN